MSVLSVIEILSALSGLALSIVLLVFPRFGPASWMLVLSVAPGFVSAAILGLTPIVGWPVPDSALLAFSCLLLCGAGCCLASYTLEREDYGVQLKKNRWFFLTIFGAAPILVAGLYLIRSPFKASENLDQVALGPVGYAAGIYLLIISVIALANAEQILRSAEEHVRWEIKFLLLGLASTFGALIYVASQVLLYAPEYSFLSLQAIHVFPAIFLCSCLLIFQSWRRSTGRGRVVVSQGVIYSSITFFSVGLYLVASSLVARWISHWTRPGIPAGPIIFLISAILLATVLLGTAFRHRARRWIRRNIFAGRYDYRKTWMDATERVRSIDTPEVAGAALAELIHQALGALDISVWVRGHAADTMRLIATRGSISELLMNEDSRLMEKSVTIVDPVSINELNEDGAREWPEGFLEQTKASLLVPLVSSGRLVGLLTVGSDRSGKGFDGEAREFLRVVAAHSAGEFHKIGLLETLVETREAEAFRTFSTFLLHDLKNFASTLSLIAKNAARLQGNPDFQRDAFQSVLQTAEHMKRLCNGLRTFSGSLAANKKPNDLNEIVREVVGTFEGSVAGSVELDLAAVPSVPVDKQEIIRVLQNLILNAREAAPDGTIRVNTRRDPSGIVLSVSDKGKGISKDFVKNGLFQPFHTTKGDGLGIGLFQSKRIVESHGGTIQIESEEGAGTVVRIVLPIPQTGTEPDVPGLTELTRATPLRRNAVPSLSKELS